jgi:hypothetical protein
MTLAEKLEFDIYLSLVRGLVAIVTDASPLDASDTQECFREITKRDTFASPSRR